MNLPDTPDKRMLAFYVFEQVLLHLLSPLLILAVLVKSIRSPGYLKNLHHRLGFGPVGPKGAVWVYAVCLGETRAVSPLVQRLIDQGHSIILSHGTPEGLAEGRRLFEGEARVTHRLVPFDLFWAVRLFLRRSEPKLGLVCEIEIWPAMLIEARRAGVPMGMVNGNLLEQILIDHDKPLGRDILRLYRLFSVVATRTEDYAARYRSIGVEPDRIFIVGDMKFDQAIEQRFLNAATALKAQWAGNGPVFMIASSTAEEEAPLLDVVTTLARGRVPCKIVWVPREPSRFAPVFAAVQGAGLNAAQRSIDLGPDFSGVLREEVEVLVGNSIGEMNFYYSLADMVFVGASLFKEGGHNVIEPFSLGKPVVMGPSIWGIEFSTISYTQMGAFKSCANKDELAAYVQDKLATVEELRKLGSEIISETANGQGASAKTLAALSSVLAN